REVVEAADPDELVGVVEVAEGAEDAHPQRLLALDELPVEELHQRFTRARSQRVAAELDDARPAGGSVAHGRRARTSTSIASRSPSTGRRTCSARSISSARRSRATPSAV